MDLGAELEAYGLSGPSKIKQVLSKTRKTNTFCNAVKKFQDENGIKIDSLPSAMNLLNLHGIKRKDFHDQAVNDVSELLLTQIRYLGEECSKKPESLEKLKALLEKSFHFHKFVQFRPVVLELLKQIPVLSEKYLKEVKSNETLYKECAMVVRQQIWMEDSEKFIEAVKPIIESYIKNKQAIVTTIDQSNTNFFSIETTKVRRQWEQIQVLISMVGMRDKLCEDLLNYIKNLYVSTRNPHICSLRTEIIMAAHDSSVDSILKKDPCHDFAWCLDACVRDKHLDPQQMNKLKNILDNCKKSTVEVIMDMSMIANDAHVVHFLASMITKRLRDSTGAHLPRDLVSLQLIIRILSLGSHCFELLSSRDVTGEVVDSMLVTKFLPALESFMIEDSMRTELIRAKTTRCDDVSIDSCLSPLSDVLITFIQANPVAALIYFHYALDLLPSKRRVGDLRGLARSVTGLTIARNKMSAYDLWIHLYIHRLIFSHQFENSLSEPQLKVLLLDELLIKNVKNNEVVKFQILRIINQIGFVWGVPACQEILQHITPDSFKETSESDKTRYTLEYQRVVEKLTPKTAPDEPLLIQTAPSTTMGGMGSPPPVRQYPAPMATPRTSY